MFGCWSFLHILASRSSFWKSISNWKIIFHYGWYNIYNNVWANMSNWRRIISLPLADNFFVFMIFEANSRPVAFWTHLLTTENAPLKGEKHGLCYKIFITKNDKKKDFSILKHERFISYDGNTCSSKSLRIIMFWLKYMFPYFMIWRCLFQQILCNYNKWIKIKEV